jgi:hypothetical protein
LFLIVSVVIDNTGKYGMRGLMSCPYTIDNLPFLLTFWF